PYFLLVIPHPPPIYYFHIQQSGYSAGSRCSGPFKVIAPRSASIRGSLRFLLITHSRLAASRCAQRDSDSTVQILSRGIGVAAPVGGKHHDAAFCVFRA